MFDISYHNLISKVINLENIKKNEENRVIEIIYSNLSEEEIENIYKKNLVKSNGKNINFP